MMAKLLLLCYCVVLSTALVNSDTVSYYSIPEPTIVAFQGGGLRIILKDEPGITTFRFHGNVNEEMKQLYPGTINIETAKKINGRWILDDKTVKLFYGDFLYYWLFVEKDRLGYVKQPVKFKIRELVPYYDEEGEVEEPITAPPMPPSAVTTTTRRTPHTKSPTSKATEATPTTACICPETTPASTIILSSLQNQIEAINRKLDLISSVSALQGQVDGLAKKFDVVSNTATLQNEVRNISGTVEVILKVLEALPESRKLTLRGSIPPDQGSNPTQVVSLVIWEKLDLQVDVVKAERNKDNTIVFEVKTIQQKFDVLRVAREKLKDARLSIS